MELPRLVTQVIQKTCAIKFIVSKLKELRFPSENPLRLARLIANIAEAIEEEILEQLQATPTSPKDFEVQVKFAVRALQSLAAHLRFTQRATTRLTPWSLVRSLQKLGKQLHPKSLFVIRPQWEYSYSLLEPAPAYEKALKKLLSRTRLERALAIDRTISDEAAVSSGSTETVEHLYILGFPYAERLSVLLHSLFGHELGHPIEKEFFKQENPSDFQNTLTAKVLEHLKYPPDVKDWDEAKWSQFIKMRDRIRKLRRRAIAELTSDLVSVTLMGPAALFATEEYALSRESDSSATEPSRHYPPWRYRLRTMADALSPEWVDTFLQNGEFDPAVSEALKTKFESIMLLIEQRDDEKNLNKNPDTRITYELVRDALPKVQLFVRERLANSGFSLDDLAKRTNYHLLQRLENWIPPDGYYIEEQLGTEQSDEESFQEELADIRTILNVGWIRWICGYSCVPIATDNHEEINKYFKKTDALNRLVLKAIEYVEIRSIWKQMMDEKERDNGSTRL